MRQGLCAAAALVAVVFASSSSALGAPPQRDPGFSGDGAKPLATGLRVQQVALSDSGDVFAAGVSLRQGVTFVERFDSRGEVDRSFAQAALSSVGMARTNFVEMLALLDSGHLVLTLQGSQLCHGGAQFCVVKLTPDGNLDRTFGADGVASPDLGLGPGVGSVVTAVDSEDRVVLLGAERLIRLREDGSVDPGFNVDPTTLPRNDHPRHLATGPGETVVLNGDLSAVSQDVAVVRRYLADGRPDGSFGTAGSVQTPGSAGRNDDEGLAVAPDGSIFFTDTYCTAHGPPCPSVLIRLTRDGEESGRRELKVLGNLEVDSAGRLVLARSLPAERGFPSTVALTRFEPGSVEAATTTYAYLRVARTEPTALAVNSRGGYAVAGKQEWPRGTHMVYRYSDEVSRPRDLDFDGTGNRKDRCELLPAPRRHACPSVKRSLRIYPVREYQGFRGKLDARTRSCVLGSRVETLRAQPGRDKVVRVRRVRGRHWNQRNLPDGRYYVRVAAGFSATGGGFCLSARTPRIEVVGRTVDRTLRRGL